MTQSGRLQDWDSVTEIQSNIVAVPINTLTSIVSINPQRIGLLLSIDNFPGEFHWMVSSKNGIATIFVLGTINKWWHPELDIKRDYKLCTADWSVIAPFGGMNVSVIETLYLG